MVATFKYFILAGIAKHCLLSLIKRVGVVGVGRRRFGIFRETRLLMEHITRSHYRCFIPSINKQLLDEAEHDIKNYSDRGQCYLPKRS